MGCVPRSGEASNSFLENECKHKPIGVDTPIYETRHSDVRLFGYCIYIFQMFITIWASDEDYVCRVFVIGDQSTVILTEDYHTGH